MGTFRSSRFWFAFEKAGAVWEVTGLPKNLSRRLLMSWCKNPRISDQGTGKEQVPRTPQRTTSCKGDAFICLLPFKYDLNHNTGMNEILLLPEVGALPMLTELRDKRHRPTRFMQGLV